MITFVLSVLIGIVRPLCIVASIAFLAIGLSYLPSFFRKVSIYFWELRQSYKYTFKFEVSTTEGFILRGTQLHQYRKLRRLLFRTGRIKKRIEKIEVSLRRQENCLHPPGYFRYLWYFRTLDCLAFSLWRYNKTARIYSKKMMESGCVYCTHAYTPDGENLLPRFLLSYQDNKVSHRRRCR